MQSSRRTRYAALTLVALLASCSFSKGPNLREIAPEINATRMGNSAVITPGDVLSIQFRQDPQYNQELTVMTDGTISLMELGSRRVAAMTPEKLSEILGEEHRGLSNNKPTVAIAEAAPRSVVVLGEVVTPGAIELGPDQRLTLLEAIGQAGGYRKASAWLSNVLLVRWDPTEQEQRAWKIDARTKFWGGAEPIYLQPYDLVFVPNTNIDEAGILLDNWVRRMLPLPYFPGI